MWPFADIMKTFVSGVREIFDLHLLRSESLATLVSARRSLEQGVDNPDFNIAEIEDNTACDLEKKQMENDSEVVEIVDEQPKALEDTGVVVVIDESSKTESSYNIFCFWLAVLLDYFNIV